MGTNLHLMELPMEGKEMLHRISMMQDKDVCLLDEAHLISQRRGAVETLLPILIGGKDSAGNRVPDVTFVAATTDKDKLPVAFLDRLPIQPYFETYTVAQMRDIIEGMCEKKSINLDAATVHGLALAANGTPRTAGTLVTHAQVLLENGESATTKSVLSLANMTPDGLSREHVNYLRTMYKNPKHVSGETVYRMGFSSIVSIMREPKETVARLERLLIDLNYIVPDTGGRCLTAKGIDFARKGF